MDIFDNSNNYITKIIDPNAENNSQINLQLMKDIIFVDSKNYKYHPSFSRIYYRSPDFKQANVISVFDEMEKEKQNLENPNFIGGFFDYLMKEYNLTKEALDDVIKVVKDTSMKEEIQGRIMSSYPQYKQNIENYFNVLPPTEIGLSSSVDVNETELSSPDRWSTTSYSPVSSEFSSPTGEISLSVDDLFKQLNREVKEEEKISVSDFEVYLRYLYIVLSKQNILKEIKYEEIFKNFKLDVNFLAVGMHLEGDSKFRIVKTSDKDLTRKIKVFTHSEHKVTQIKTLLPDTLYFLYYIEKDIYISGKLRNNMVIVLRVVFSENSPLKDIEKIEKKLSIHTYKISELFKKLIPNLIENPDKNFVKISIKLKHSKGKIDKDIIKRTFVTNMKETHKGTVISFDLKIDDTTTMKNVIYSEKGGYSNFTIKDIPNKTYIAEVVNKITYPFKIGSEIQETEKKEVKKQKIKDLTSLGIPYDSRKCQKNRRVEVLQEGEEYPQNRILNYKGNLLVCKNPEYPYPGETKTGIPCCFKKIQVKKEVKQTKSIDADKALNIRPLLKEKEELVQFRREGINNRLLEDIFPVDEGFYALTLSDTKIGIPEVLDLLYGENIIKESFSNLQSEDRQYLGISDETDLKNIIKAVTLHKQINLFVVTYTDTNDFSFVCSMSDFLLFDKFIIILFNKNNYKILVKSDDTRRQIGWELTKANPNLQRLIRAYNSSCLNIKECSYNVPDLKKVLLDNVLKVKNGIVDPIINKIIYLETDRGIIPIKQSKVSYSITTKFINEMEILSLEDETNYLKSLEDIYGYLKVTGTVTNEKKTSITGIKTVCNFVIPVKEKQTEQIPETSEVFEIDIASKLKEEVISGEELEAYNEDFIENYKEVILNTVKKYYNEREEEKNIILNFVYNAQFEGLLEHLNKLFVVKDKVEIPIENSTIVPIPIEEKHKLEFLSYLTWILMNNSEELFTESIVRDRTQIDVSLIPNLEEVEISFDT